MTLLYLIGFMGAGKSTLAKLASKKWNHPLYDTDALIRGEFGISAEELLRDPVNFRLQEADLVAELAGHDRGIISLGGGAIENSNSRKLLQGEAVVFLDPGAEICWQRVQADPQQRPLAADYPSFTALYQRRLPLYLTVCRWHFTDNLPPGKILHKLEENCRMSLD